MNPNAKLIDSLRQAADFLEQHPELPHFSEDAQFLTCVNGGRSASEQRAALADVARKYAPVEKRFMEGSDLFRLIKHFGNLEFRWLADREVVCRRVETKKLIPAQPERTLPAEPEREEVEVTWECDGSLLAEREAVDAN